MRKLLLVGGLFSCAIVVIGCPLKKSGDVDAAADAALVEPEAAAPPPLTEEPTDAAPAPAAVTAKNSADVARFPGETPVSDDDMKLASVAVARSSPKSGAAVATIRPGADVTKIAEYQDSILVTFADPKDASSSLMGWIGKDSFTAPKIVKRVDAGVTDAGAPATVDAGPQEVTCPAGQIAVVLSKDPTCRKRCAKDSDCKAGAAGGCAVASTAAGKVAKVCVAGD